MTSVQIAFALSEITKTNKTIFVTCNPEIIDFPNNGKTTLEIHNNEKQIKIPLEPNNLKSISGYLEHSILSEDITVIGWNLKNLITYFLHVTGKAICFKGQAFDLRLLERYLGKDTSQQPKSFIEAVRRLKTVVKDEVWGKLAGIHKKVHLPLSFCTIPNIETSPLLDERTRNYVYSYYEIEGQKNGRMNCLEPFGERGFNPHVVGPEMRERLLPRKRDEFFLYFDYEHMEISMLQWLSRDCVLGGLLETPGDVYAKIYELVGGVSDREKGKKLVLPVVYGESPSSLAKVWAIGYDEAKGLINSLRSHFGKSFEWIEQELVGGVAEDYFGRRRIFEEKQYRARNFRVQSPASLVCLEKLVELEKAIRGQARIAFHCYDGYVLTVPFDGWHDIAVQIKSVLESPSHFCPDLKLTVGCKGGKKLGELRKLRIN